MPRVATVGTFDGVHLGHVAILATVGAVAQEKGMKSCVITFNNHPLSVVAPGRKPRWAMQRSVSLDYLGCYVDEVIPVDFTAELAAMTASEFMGVLKESYDVRTIVMGYDNTFGSDRLVAHEDYGRAAAAAGIEVVWVEAETTGDGRPVSSSRLRKALSDGDVALARELCGCRPLYSGVVAEGKKLGRKIGFPTMNVRIDEDVVGLPDGVYACEVTADGDGGCDAGLLSISTAPTVDTGLPRVWEIHVPGRDLGDMYGRRIDFVVDKKLRDIKKFDSLDELEEAIRKDIAALRKDENGAADLNNIVF